MLNRCCLSAKIILFFAMMTASRISLAEFRAISKSVMRKASTLSMSNSFFESIGSPRFISAPMVDQSNLAWRLLVKGNGADLAFSQMMHARNFMTDKNYRSDCVDWDDYTHSSGVLEASKAKLLDSPLIVQLAGDDPNVLVGAGKFVHHDVAAIDLNLGCPQKIAKKGNYGAYLLPDKALIVKILSTMVKELDCPITAKVRCLSTDAETLDLCKAIENCGVSMITVHGRTADSNKLFMGAADWEIIRKVKNTLSIPVIANGGISSREDALRCLEVTGADGVMSSEALLGNPKMFSEEGDRRFREDFARSQLETADNFLEILQSHKLPRPLYQVVRSHLFKMLYRFSDAPNNVDLRMQLANGDFEMMKNVVVQLHDRMSKIDYQTEVGVELGLIGKTHWYYRHRDEKALQRRHSIPRKKVVRAPIVLNPVNEEPSDKTIKGDGVSDDLVLKMKLLKEKLSNRKTLKEDEVAQESTSTSSREMSNS